MTKTEFEQVREVIDTYFTSLKTLDFNLMRSVAHLDGRIYIGNSSTSKNLHDHWADDEKLLADPKRVKALKNMKVKLLALQIEGTIAYAKIQMGIWLDNHILVKTLEGWKLVDKVSHRIDDNLTNDYTKLITEQTFKEVKKVMDTYVLSANELDFPLMRTVAHVDGRIFLGNTSTSKNLHVHWGDENRQYSPERKEELKKNMRVKLLTLQVEGTIAFARIFMNGWIDYHNLVKTTEGWKLVDKVSHKIE
ncbi:MAG: nuclear transport factor 2 family protein [Asgard group archaeon]|nr:nuclear transport factor 2 family protein [Asgard group archaeon]